MKRIITFSTIFCFSLILSSCNKEPLITEEYSIMQVYIEGQIVLETENKENIGEVIKKINTESRETTHEMSLPDPIGKIVFKNNKQNLTAYLYGSGNVTVDVYIVDTGFEF
ncbi:hypothetical protein E3U55_16775 [Filobacillus milosensis]|uniref:DUF3221 domain-containing protein n=1 Tax=Filobacillus milosensis TaxID=94137 RepID=A0A4Y8ID49_9BACI|nr:hypothetical protein [Filobacillus milosensis]TFB13033.1 hypothetical protein E3U55_16775 [Filobacillus milosensis]